MQNFALFENVYQLHKSTLCSTMGLNISKCSPLSNFTVIGNILISCLLTTQMLKLHFSEVRVFSTLF